MSSEVLQARLAVIAEPNRFRIVELLVARPHAVGEIVTELGIGQPQVSRHLRILTDAGVVRARKQAQQRIYSLEPRPFSEITEWLDSFSHVWAERMDALDDFLQETEHTDRSVGTGGGQGSNDR
jgi:DNA-binding transcriptional ArsR family regulator